MRRAIIVRGGVLACGAVLASAVAVWSCGYGMPSPAMRFLGAECVVAGRVIGFEDQNLHALPFATALKDQEYKIAIVHVLHALKGAEGEKHVRVGLAPTQALRNGQEVLLFLTPHFEESFFVLNSGRYEYAITRDSNPDFDNQVARYQGYAKTFKDPLTALKSNDAQERLRTAVLLVNYYRTFLPAVHNAAQKTQPLGAEQSKLILEALAGADWSKGDMDFRMTPWRAFNLLRATPKDGWNPQGIRNSQELESAARRWLRENAETFRVTTFVRK